MRKVDFAAGEVILQEGEEGDTAFLITAGAVEVLIGEGARARTVAKLAAGDVFGEISLIEPGPRSATVRAIEDTRCAMTSFDEFMSWIEEDPAQVRRTFKVNGLMFILKVIIISSVFYGTVKTANLAWMRPVPWRWPLTKVPS